MTDWGSNPHDWPHWDLWVAEGLTEAEMQLKMEAERLAIDLSGVKPVERSFFEQIIMVAEHRPVRSDDFRDFVGCSNWLLVDDEDIPENERWVAGEFDIQTGYICEFMLRRILDDGKVEILIGIGPNYAATRNVESGIAMHIDADELALRMDAS